MATASLLDSQKVNLSISATNAAGNPVVGSISDIVWSVSDSTVATVAQQADGSADLITTGKLGVCTVSASSASVSFTATVDVTVTADPRATGFAVVVGAPVSRI